MGADIGPQIREVDVATTQALPAHERDPRDANVLRGVIGNGALAAIDGTMLGERRLLLVKNEADGTENGVYEREALTPAEQTTLAWKLRRVPWLDGNEQSGGDVGPLLVRVKHGTKNRGQWFDLTAFTGAAVNDNPVTFAPFLGVSGDGISVPGATFSGSGPHVFGTAGATSLQLKFLTKNNDATPIAFFQTTFQLDNAAGPHDQVFAWSWNGGAGGAPVVAGEPVWGLGLEANFLQSSERYCELNLNYLGADGTTGRRPVAIFTNRATHATGLGFSGVTDFYNSASSVNVLRVNEDGQIVLFDVSANAAFIRYGNEMPILKGQKTAGSGGALMEVVRIDASNRMSFDNAVAAVSLLLNTAIVQIGRVSIGGNTTMWFDNSATPKIGVFGVAAAGAPVVQQTRGATLTNNVTAGGSNDVIADFSDLTTYSNSAATIRNNFHQLARALRMHDVAQRAYGWMT